MNLVKQKLLINVDLSNAFEIIREKTGCGQTQKEIAKAIRLAHGDFASRKGRGTLAQYIIDWGGDRGIMPDVLFPELNEHSAATGTGYNPPMWNGEPQDWISLGGAWLAELDCRPGDLRCFEHNDGFALMPDWGVALGDYAIIDTSKAEFVSDGLYIMDLETGPGLRAVLKRPGGLIIERPVDRGGGRTPAVQPILGKAVGHAGRL